MSDGEFRFVVGDPAARSASWRAWVGGDGSFYVAPREMKGAVKVSLHPPKAGEPEDGWFFGFTEEFAGTREAEPKGHPRLERFRVEPRRPGVTRVCTVRINSAVVNWDRPLRKPGFHTWIPKPSEGAAAEIVFFLISAPEFQLVSDEASLIGALANERGDRLVALAREVPVTERLRMSGDMGPDATDTDLAQVRMVAMGTLTEDGSAVFEEVCGEGRYAWAAGRMQPPMRVRSVSRSSGILRT